MSDSIINQKLSDFDVMPKMARYQVVMAGRGAVADSAALYGLVDDLVNGDRRRRENCLHSEYLFDDVIIAQFPNSFRDNDDDPVTMWRILFRKDGKWRREIEVYTEKGVAIMAGVCQHYQLPEYHVAAVRDAIKYQRIRHNRFKERDK